jgi:tetratricopeptide (TPR) repeat protein
MLTLPFARPVFVALALLYALEIPVSAKDAWIEVRSSHFLVVSNAGDREARKVADQFEQFREVFQATFPKLRVDLGKPLIIFALKNEDSMRQLIPEYWEVKGRVHPDGLYVPAEDAHSVVVRTDVEADNPYQVIYHEYTHALMDLNFRGLPIWFGEGLAEFFGNSTLKDKNVELGQIAPAHLQILQQSRLIPIESLLQADHRSPYYNEQNRASVFYAESWAIVHYLLLDPEARKRQLLQNFLNAWDASGNQVEAAQKTFGDLRKFSQVMEAYAHQSRFFVAAVKTGVHADPKSYAGRALSQAEAEAYRGEFFVRTNRPKEATTSLEYAVQAEPNLTLAHEGLGLLALHQLQYDLAETELARAIELNSPNFIVYYYSARARFRSGLIAPGDSDKAIADLEKSIQLNPQFAASYATIASAYSTKSADASKAIAAARKAMQLEPGNLQYTINYGFVLLNAGKLDEAKILASRLLASAKSPAEQSNAMQFSEAVTSRQAYATRVAGATAPDASNSSAGPSETTKTDRSSILISPSIPSGPLTPDGKSTPSEGSIASGGPPLNPGSTSFSASGYKPYALEGQVTSIDCAKATDGRLGLRTHSIVMEFHYRDRKDLKVSSVATATTTATAKPDPTCASWKGRKVRVVFYPTPEQSFDGELVEIQFF